MSDNSQVSPGLAAGFWRLAGQPPERASVAEDSKDVISVDRRGEDYKLGDGDVGVVKLELAGEARRQLATAPCS